MRASTGLEFPCTREKDKEKKKTKCLKENPAKKQRLPVCPVGKGERGGQFFPPKCFNKMSKQKTISTRRHSRKKDILDPHN